MSVRRAVLEDLPYLIKFTAEEAREAENSIKIPETLTKGIKKGLEDDSIAMYWVLSDENDTPIGSVSALKEWSDWNAGYYWWIQSMYLVPDQRGKGKMKNLLDAVRAAMAKEEDLQLRLYVHEENKAAIKAYNKAKFVHSKYKIMTLD